MQNLHLFSIKNKIDLESNHSLFKSNLYYECSFVVNNKIILFNNKNCFLKFRELKKLNIKKENLYFLGKKDKTVFIGVSGSLRKIKTALKDKTFSLVSLRDCINLVNNEHVSYLSALFFLERWKNENVFCSKCGAKNRFNNLKNYIECTNKICLKRIFPKHPRIYLVELLYNLNKCHKG